MHVYTHMCICVKSFVTAQRPDQVRALKCKHRQRHRLKWRQCFIYKVKQNLWMLTMNCEMRQPEKSKCEA